MALVAYSDSEASDAEPETAPAPTPPADTTKKADPSADAGAGFQVDRSNPRKIRVALPQLKPENPAGHGAEDGPARKRARVGGDDGGAGDAFSGFNALLPAPKRAAEKKAPVASTRKVFSLKTGATPGFDREADAEMKRDQAFSEVAQDGNGDADEVTIPAAGSLDKGSTRSDPAPEEKKTEPGQVKLQGNPMMFRPLSVGRTQKKKKTPKTISQPTSTSSATPTTQPSETGTSQLPPSPKPVPSAPAPSKPKVSLFSLSSEETTAPSDTTPAPSATYEPLVYNSQGETPSAGPALPPELTPAAEDPSSTAAATSSHPTSLDAVADDLHLSRAERRQLFGRHAQSAQSRVLTFNTNEEYASNQALSQAELAATQHAPVRAIAPGKHTLQQLVNAASSQREALEESFATGRRNKKEAGSKYGW